MSQRAAWQTDAGAPMSRRGFLVTLPALGVAGRLAAATQAAPVRVVGIHQVTLAVADVERSLAFYQELFGMPVQARHDDRVLLRIGDGPRFLGLTEAGTDGPGFAEFGLAVEDFDAARVLTDLSDLGIRGGQGGAGPTGGPLSVRASMRGRTREVRLGDPDGLVVQLLHRGYCGGGGPLGDMCGSPESSATSGSLALRDMSHLTISVPDPGRSNEFYRRTFGLDVQTMQAASAALGVGPGVHFLMFIAAGGRRGGGAPPARVHHACFGVDDFDLERVQRMLERHGIQPRAGSGPGPLRHWVSMRMPNRGGAPDGTPELYFSDPDGLAIQLQDVTYCGGGGYLGDECD